jgi:hypothetical protein
MSCGDRSTTAVQGRRPAAASRGEGAEGTACVRSMRVAVFIESEGCDCGASALGSATFDTPRRTRDCPTDGPVQNVRSRR